MDSTTIRRLNQINQEFYRTAADDFDQTRQQAWPGWERLLPHIRALRGDGAGLSILDVGCGNGRFGLFLREHLGDGFSYHGVDNNPALLERAALAGLPNVRLETRDLVDNPPDEGEYDLVALFGVLHHIPGYEGRRTLMRQLAARVKAGGLLTFACWRFIEFERFRERIVPWPPGFEVETHDYLLDWRRGERAHRYCHYVDDSEHADLIAASGMREIETFRADGPENRANRYSILQDEKGFRRS